MRLIAAIMAGMLVTGCDPKVSVYDDCLDLTHTLSFPEEVCGQCTSFTSAETPSNYTVIVIFEKKGYRR